MRPDQQKAGTESGGGCARISILLFATWGLFAFLLRGFVSTKSLIVLSLTGAVLLDKAGDAVIDVAIREMDGRVEQLNLIQTPRKKEQTLAT